MIKLLFFVGTLFFLVFGSWRAEASARSNLICTEYLCVSYFKGARPQLQSLNTNAQYVFGNTAEPEFPGDKSTLDLSFTNGLKLRFDISPYEKGGCAPSAVFSTDGREFIEVLCLHGVDGYQNSRVVVFGKSEGSPLDLRFARTISLEQQLVPRGAVYLLQSMTTREAEMGGEGS